MDTPELSNLIEEMENIIRRLSEVSSIFEKNSEEIKLIEDASSIIESLRLYEKENYKEIIEKLKYLPEDNINKNRILGSVYAGLYDQIKEDETKRDEANMYLSNEEYYFRTYIKYAKSYDKKDKIGRANLVNVHTERKDYKNAENDLQKLIIDYPQEGAFYYIYGRIIVRTAENSDVLDKALEKFKDARRLGFFVAEDRKNDFKGSILDYIKERYPQRFEEFSNLIEP